jgi:hypothetical protein
MDKSLANQNFTNREIPPGYTVSERLIGDGCAGLNLYFLM